MWTLNWRGWLVPQSFGNCSLALLCLVSAAGTVIETGSRYKSQYLQVSRGPFNMEMLTINDQVTESSTPVTTVTDYQPAVENSTSPPEESATKEENEPEESLLQPGKRIRPDITDEEVKSVVQRLYGITIEHQSELHAYDDRNYFITADSRYKNPIITSPSPHGYVLKVLNALDSKKIGFIDAQTKLLRFVSENGISCPKPVANVYGRNFSLEYIRGQEHVIRLLEFIPGKTLDSVTFTDHLFYQAGVFIGNFDRVVCKFEHDGYQNHQSIWQLENVDKLEEFVYVLKDEEKQQLVEDVIGQFKKEVQPKRETFQRGLIHGDFNEHNILVTKSEITKQYYVSGILDFGDSSYSHYLFEVAIAMTYMMLISKNLKAGGLVLAGYESVRPMPKEEKALLKICVAARLAQSLVLGMYTSTVDPNNEYILSSQKNGWCLLDDVWKNENIEKIWTDAEDDYLKRSER